MLAITVYMTVELFGPKPLNWQVSYSGEDKNPFGGQVFHTLVRQLFPENEVASSYETIFELVEADTSNYNILVIAESFYPDAEDMEALFEHVARGGHALISANYMSGGLADSLKLRTRDLAIIDRLNSAKGSQLDTIAIHFTHQRLSAEGPYHFDKKNASDCFYQFDTARCMVVAKNNRDYPVTLRVNHGQGSLLLNSTPMMFTNNYILYKNNHELVANTLSLLPNSPTIWTEYYQVGRREPQTPLRVILTTAALKWAYLVAVGLLLSFIIFESKRKQRVIPIIKPLANTSLDFAKAIGNLYYKGGNHKDIANKKVRFFLDSIKERYYLKQAPFNDAFYRLLASKSGKDYDFISRLFRFFKRLETQTHVSEYDLKTLNKRIEEFYKH